MKRAIRAAVAVLLLVGVSCSSIEGVAPARALLDVAMPDHMAYVEADDSLDDDQKAIRRLAWESFESWVQAHEER